MDNFKDKQCEVNLHTINLVLECIELLDRNIRLVLENNKLKEKIKEMEKHI